MTLTRGLFTIIFILLLCVAFINGSLLTLVLRRHPVLILDTFCFLTLVALGSVPTFRWKGTLLVYFHVAALALVLVLMSLQISSSSFYYWTDCKTAVLLISAWRPFTIALRSLSVGFVLVRLVCKNVEYIVPVS